MIAELCSALIMKEQDTIAGGDRNIGFSVIVIVADSTADCIPHVLQSRLFRGVLKAFLSTIQI